MNSDSKKIALVLTRVSFGLALALVGFAHYRDPAAFADFVGSGFPYLWLRSLAMIWGYILPGLLIVGGLSFAFYVSGEVGTWAVGIALGSIPVGMVLKSVLGTSLSDTMPQVMSAFIWLLVFSYVAGSGDGEKAGKTERVRQGLRGTRKRRA